MKNLEASRVVAKAENLSASYVLSVYDEATIGSLVFLYNREREIAAETMRENW